MSKLFSLLADDGQYVCLYVLESKIAYMALKIIEEDVSPVLSFDAVFLAKFKIDISKNVFEVAIHKKRFWKKTELCGTFTNWLWRTTVNYNNKARNVDIWSWLTHLLLLMFVEQEII